MNKFSLALGFTLVVSNYFSQNDTDMIIADLNPKNLVRNFKQYEQSTALFLAQLSEVAYWDSTEISTLQVKMQNEYPSSNFHFELIEDRQVFNHNQALLCGTKDFMVVAFRGTEPTILKDWFSDSKYFAYENLPEKNEELSYLPAGHAGFRKATIRLMIEKDIFKKIDEFIKMCSSNADIHKFPIYLTGHSLGAAISQLFIHPLKYRKYNFLGAYHFAPPLAVSCDQNQQMKSDYNEITYDIVNYKDYVPRAGRNSVAHFGKFYRICNDGLIYKEDEAYVKFKISELKDEVKLHSLKNHIQYIRSRQNNLSEIEKRSKEKKHFPCMELDGEPTNLCGE